MQPSQSLKSKLIKGGIALTIRQLVSSFLSLLSALVIARVLGPKLYGILATSLGIFYFFKWTGRGGLNIYLTRKPESNNKEIEEILAFYNTVGVAFCILLWLAAPAFGGWTGEVAVVQILRWLTPAIWLDMVGGLSTALLARELRFAEVGLIDAIAQIANYSLSIPLVLLNWGYWGPVIGYFLQFLLFALLSYYRCPIKWRWRWNWKILQPALHYGFTYYCSNWILTFRSLTVPLIISRLAGMEAAGIASISIRIVQQISLLRQTIAEMSISVMGKFMTDLEKVRHIISKGMAYQALVMAPACATFACFATWIIPTFFGKQWLSSTQLFPFIALAACVGAIFDLHNSTLYAAGLNREVAIQNLGYVGSLWVGSALCTPPLGLLGYGVAEILAMPSYFLIHKSLAKLYGSPNYWNAFLITLAAVPALVGGVWLPPLLGFGILIVSYGMLFILNQSVRTICLELWSFMQWRKKSEA